MRWPLTVLRVLAQEVAPAQLDRIEAELLGELVELHLEREARLHPAVAALGSAGRLVGEHARRVEAVGGEVVRPGQELARVVRGDQAEGRVRAAVDQDLRVDTA